MPIACPRSTPLLVSFLLLFALAACQPVAADPSPATPTATVLLPTHTPSPTPRPILPTLSPTFEVTKTVVAEADRRVTLMAVGDIMLARTIGERIETEGAETPFTFTAETLSSADITVGNLECAISTRGTPEEKSYTFEAPLSAAQSLAFAGFDVVSLANNHVLDYGLPALEETLSTLNANGIAAVGAGLDERAAYRPVFMDVNGLRIAFLAFADVSTIDYDYLAWQAGPDSPGIAWAHPEQVEQSVRAAKAEADLVVVLVHNGVEMMQRVYEPQQTLAHLAIDSGAALVIGSHPHVLQRIEAYNGGLIAYSMGNFVFDNMLFPPNYSAILSVTLTPEGVASYELVDVIVQLNGVPQIMEYDLENYP